MESVGRTLILQITSEPGRVVKPQVRSVASPSWYAGFSPVRPAAENPAKLCRTFTYRTVRRQIHSVLGCEVCGNSLHSNGKLPKTIPSNIHRRRRLSCQSVCALAKEMWANNRHRHLSEGQCVCFFCCFRCISPLLLNPGSWMKHMEHSDISGPTDQ